MKNNQINNYWCFLYNKLIKINIIILILNFYDKIIDLKKKYSCQDQ